MTVVEYAKSKGVSKQSIYDKLKRGTLSAEVIDGKRHVVEQVSKPHDLESIETLHNEALEKVLKRLKKIKGKVDSKNNKIQLLEAEVVHKQEMLNAKDGEIESLRHSLWAVQNVVAPKTLAITSAPSGDIEADEADVADVEDVEDSTPTPKKKNKKKKKKKKNKD